MELYELKYFLGVARTENIHKASEKLHVSTASLSKAIARLEDELKVVLFLRERRHIRLTPAGRLLQQRASEMVLMEESLRQEISVQPGSVHAVITGPEILLAKHGTALSATIQ